LTDISGLAPRLQRVLGVTLFRVQISPQVLSSLSFKGENSSR
jgi:hypothetical protein